MHAMPKQAPYPCVLRPHHSSCAAVRTQGCGPASCVNTHRRPRSVETAACDSASLAASLFAADISRFGEADRDAVPQTHRRRPRPVCLTSTTPGLAPKNLFPPEATIIMILSVSVLLRNSSIYLAALHLLKKFCAGEFQVAKSLLGEQWAHLSVRHVHGVEITAEMALVGVCAL